MKQEKCHATHRPLSIVPEFNVTSYIFHSQFAKDQLHVLGIYFMFKQRNTHVNNSIRMDQYNQWTL